jgi:hypothetical protein
MFAGRAVGEIRSISGSLAGDVDAGLLFPLPVLRERVRVRVI